MRIQSIVLEDHCDISVFGLNVVHELAVDAELTGADIFKTCDHTKCGGFAAARRTDENDEFLVSDFHVEILNSLETIGIYLVDILQR
jgi:hypothetical protein